MSALSPLKPEECNCFVVRSAARHVTQLYDQLLAPVELHVTQFSILAKLKRLGPITINALAKEMLMDRTTLGRNVLPLEREGLIKIETSADDLRAKNLHLTKAGDKRLQAALAAWARAQARFETRFGAKRAADFRAMLRAVIASDFSGLAEQRRSSGAPTEAALKPRDRHEHHCYWIAAATRGRGCREAGL